MALWIAAGANPKEVAARAGHALDRYGHLYPEADLSLRERLQAITRPAGRSVMACGPGAAPATLPGHRAPLALPAGTR